MHSGTADAHCPGGYAMYMQQTIDEYLGVCKVGGTVQSGNGLTGPSIVKKESSLPPKPTVLPSSFDSDADVGSSSGTGGKVRAQHARNTTPLPSLPLAPTRHPLPERPLPPASATSSHNLPRPPKKVTPVMLGVKIRKHKEAE